MYDYDDLPDPATKIIFKLLVINTTAQFFSCAIEIGML